MSKWEQNANYVADEFGGYVNREERFYLCPFCGEPVYECDWSDEDFGNFVCPVCEDEDAEGKE